ncbi:DUF4435 domain-containing protein [Candidatus Poribacteria bacterium]|nr:DUF4435 domain-containing protein [Candidatus Poribacteria bacterium]
MMPSRQLTVDEIVGVLKRSSVPTILVEGDDDMMIYRWMAERIGIYNVDPLPCGGRTALLEVYKRRTEFSRLQTAFVADQDMWLFTAIPPEYADIVWTEGYSIENDLYAGANLEVLLDRDEASEHTQVLKSLIEWFAFEVEEYRRGNEARVSTHPNEIVPPGTTNISPQFIAERGYRQPDHTTIAEIEEQYKLKLRGKTLFQLLVRYLSASSRKEKYSFYTLYKKAFKILEPHVYMERLVKKIEYVLKNS